MSARMGQQPRSDGRSEPASQALAECPVDPVRQRWLESAWRWFAEEFGTDVLNRGPVLPTADFLTSADYSASPAQIDTIIRRLCTLMLVDPQQIRLELFDGAADRKQAAQTGRSRAVGHFRIVDGRAVIALDQSESSDRTVLTAIAAHELCHLRLLGEGRIRRERPDGERLTDLLTVYFGFGILSTNAAMRFTRSDRGWSAAPLGELDDLTLNAARHEGYHRLGYLDSAEFGYALACYCWLRREHHPKWARYVNPGPLAHLHQGLAFLSASSAAGQLPTQSVLDKSVRIGDATLRVTRGNVIGVGSLSLTLPDLTARPPGQDAPAG